MTAPSLTPAPKPGLFRRTPPAIFPGIFGLLGLGLAWRQAAAAFQLPTAIPESILGAVTLLYLFALLSYGIKLLRRPGVIVEDLRILPGRTGLSTMTLSVLLLAVVALPYDRGLATGLLSLGLALHAALAILVIYVLATGPEEQRIVTPAWHLSFVGFILGPLTAVPLGLTQLAQGITLVTGLAAALVYGVSVAQLLRRIPPAPLRPLLAIHLAPASLFGTVAVLFGNIQGAWIFAALGLLILLALILRAGFVIEAGFSALWSAFTFPVAAFAGLCLALANTTGAMPARLLGAIVLVAATIAIPMIVTKVLKAWAKGALAAKTNAAIA